MPDLVDNSEAHCSIGWQGFGVVLHHALQPRAGLEPCFAGVLVLRIYKLSNDALGLLQGLDVRVHLQDELVDVTCTAPDERGCDSGSAYRRACHQDMPRPRFCEPKCWRDRQTCQGTLKLGCARRRAKGLMGITRVW